MQCLLGSIFHSGNSERAHRLSIRFRDVNTSERLRLIASTLECMYCLCLLFWCVPNFLVHTRGFLAIVFRHSSNGENLAADTSESAGVARLAPCPICRPSSPARYALGVGERCGGWLASLMAYHSAASLETAPTALRRRHLLRLICRFASFSRVKHLREVCPLSRPVMLSM